MPNPPIVVCDTDGLVQAFKAREIRPLRVLKDAYAIQPVIMPEVENELAWLNNGRFDRDLGLALSKGMLQVLDQSALTKHFGGSAHVPPATITAAWSTIQSSGATYRKHVDRGEAYTHAAAAFLSVPALSHDMRAVRTLLRVGLRVGTPILRYFDILTLCRQIGEMDEVGCDQARKGLLQENERIQAEFVHASFKDGLSKFSPRIADGNSPRIGMPCVGTECYERELIVTRVIPQFGLPGS
jgi:hypothetical protein